MKPERKQEIMSFFVLTTICIISAALLAFTHNITQANIGNQESSKIQSTFKEIFPDAEKFIPEKDYYLIKKENIIIGIATITYSQGYSSNLKIMVGMDTNKRISGIRVLEQAETPGLGAKVVEPEFYNVFSGLELSEVALKKDKGKIDGITSATITTKAVIDGIQNASQMLASIVDQKKEEISRQNKD